MIKLKKILSLSLTTIFMSTFSYGNLNSKINAYAATANIINIDPSIQYQTMEGFGTSLAWWAKLVGEWSEEPRQEIMDLTFNKDKGLGLNLVRYNIGGATSPKDTNLRPGADVESYLKEDGTYDWTKDEGQRYVLKTAKKIIEDGGDEFKSEAFSNSPPYFMTKSGYSSGSLDGGSNLKDDEYENFANYLAEVVNHFKENEGINFDTIDPMNEPSSNYWKSNGNQEGCGFVSPAEKGKIYEELSKSLKDKNLSTKLSGFDETSIDLTCDSINSVSKDTLDKISQINTHEYGGSKRTELRDLALSLGKTLYMNEMCCSGGNSHNHDDMDNGFKLADYIFKDLRDMKVPAWYIWQVVDDEEMNSSNNSNWGLISAYWSGENKEKYYLTKQYYALAHFSKFIRPGYKIIDSDNSDVVAAIDTSTDNLIIVARNENNKDNNFIFDISKFDTSSSTVKAYRTSESENLNEIDVDKLEDGYLKDTLPENSMVTYVISNAKYSGEVGTEINDGVNGNSINMFNYYGSWNDNNSQSGAYSNDEHYCNEKDSYYSVKFNGNKVKVYGTIGSDAGIAAISIDDGDEVLVDLYSDTREDNALMYTSPILSQGEHSVKVRITGDKNESSTSTYVVADRIVSFNNAIDEKINAKPLLTKAIGRSNSIFVQYKKVEGAESYNIKYGTESGNYTNVINNVKEDTCLIPNLDTNKKYFICISAIVDGKESEDSNQLCESTLLPSSSNLIYYVNCGDSTPLDLEENEEVGINNSVEDQAYGLDSLTGYKWGYIADDNSVWSQDTQSTTNSNYGCERQYDGDKESGGLNYKFELSNGKYKVIMGFYDPWNHDERLENILINDNMVSENLCPNKIGMVEQNYETTVTDGILNIRVEKAKNCKDKPLVSWIKVIKD